MFFTIRHNGMIGQTTMDNRRVPRMLILLMIFIFCHSDVRNDGIVVICSTDIPWFLDASVINRYV